MAFIVYDLEYTTWEGAYERNWSGPGEHREVVQFGAVRLADEIGLAELGSFEAIVAPRINPVVSGYFAELTGIDQSRIEREGMDFADAFARFGRFAEGARGLLANGSDEAVLRENCRLYRLAWPFPEGFCRNVSRVLALAAGRADHVVSSSLPEVFGSPAPGRAHDGLADACAIAAALRLIQQRRQERPSLAEIIREA